MEYINGGYTATAGALEQFLTEKREQGCGEEKICKIRKHVLSLYGVLPENRIVTKERLTKWRQGLRERGLSSRTVATMVLQ